MKPATISQIKKELVHKSPSELIELCLRLSKFKLENKEMLSYLLFNAANEQMYIQAVKEEMSKKFLNINTKSYFYIRKSIRKILRDTKKHIRYSKNKETEVELLLYFCSELKNMSPPITGNLTLQNIFFRQIALIEKLISGLHEDLQYDYNEEIKLLQ